MAEPNPRAALTMLVDSYSKRHGPAILDNERRCHYPAPPSSFLTAGPNQHSEGAS